jgi:hypothetical protein
MTRISNQEMGAEPFLDHALLVFASFFRALRASA